MEDCKILMTFHSFYKDAKGVLFVIVLYTPTHISLEGVLFMYSLKNANINRI